MTCVFTVTTDEWPRMKSLIGEISARGLRQTTKDTGLDRKTIRAVLNRKKVKIATLAKIVFGLQRN